jgi:serine/threonine-protein kinase HipA
MPQKPLNPPLHVVLNDRMVGSLLKEPSGARSFRYGQSWLSRSNALPVSLSLPLREDAFRGERVAAVIESLPPGSDAALRTVEEKLPRGFPEYIHQSVKAGVTSRLKLL